MTPGGKLVLHIEVCVCALEFTDTYLFLILSYIFNVDLEYILCFSCSCINSVVHCSSFYSDLTFILSADDII